MAGVADTIAMLRQPLKTKNSDEISKGPVDGFKQAEKGEAY
jgi:hypothetical protein